MNKLYNISWDWIAIALLTALFLYLLYSLIKDLRRTKEVVENKIREQKCKSNLEKEYLTDINNSKIVATSKLKSNIDKFASKTSQDKVVESLQKNYKEIKLSDKEERIFLDIAANRDIGIPEVFNLEELIDKLTSDGVVTDPITSYLNYNLIGNREIIEDILILLNKHQTREHQYRDAKFSVKLNDKKSSLLIKIARELKLTKEIKKVIKKDVTPLYTPSQYKKYYGFYLYLVKELANRVNSTLKINLDSSHYRVAIEIPIDIKEEDLVSSEPEATLKVPKNALIVTDSKKGYLLTQYLKRLNFNTSIESVKEVNREIPNFMDYDVVFMDSKLFEPILTDYLETIKQYTNLKIIALLDKENALFPLKLVDDAINIEELDSSIYNKITTLYSRDIKRTQREDINCNEIYPSNRVVTTNCNRRVLIADDDITNLHILTYLLKKYNLEVVAKKDGKEVMKELKNREYDLIILDSIMPEMDGFETIKKIREDKRFNATPIIIHSSFSMDNGGMERIFEYGFDSYLPKPFNKEDLDSLVNRYLSRKDSTPSGSKNILESDLKEFIAIYGDSDKMLERYIKDNRDEQALALLNDLKDIAKKIDAKKVLNSVDDIQRHIESSRNVDSDLIYKLSNNLKEIKNDIMKRLSA